MVGRAWVAGCLSTSCETMITRKLVWFYTHSLIRRRRICADWALRRKKYSWTMSVARASSTPRSTPSNTGWPCRREKSCLNWGWRRSSKASGASHWKTIGSNCTLTRQLFKVLILNVAIEFSRTSKQTSKYYKKSWILSSLYLHLDDINKFCIW